MKKPSIAGENSHAEEHGMGSYNMGDPVGAWDGAGGALEGAVVVGGIGATGAGFSVGPPKESVLSYEVAIETDRDRLMGHGTAAEAASAVRSWAPKPAQRNVDSLQPVARQEAEPVLVSR
jgi:hypothetical protein